MKEVLRTSKVGFSFSWCVISLRKIFIISAWRWIRFDLASSISVLKAVSPDDENHPFKNCDFASHSVAGMLQCASKL
jgi:hypothetical protein